MVQQKVEMKSAHAEADPDRNTCDDDPVYGKIWSFCGCTSAACDRQTWRSFII